ncbi:MAG: hypothetical protein R3E60_05530 [Alphaproteobacteria bacterium]
MTREKVFSIYGNMNGHQMYHASLDPKEYDSLLRIYGFDVVLHHLEDPNCGGYAVWLAQYH